jgi:hypothetical protein
MKVKRPPRGPATVSYWRFDVTREEAALIECYRGSGLTMEQAVTAMARAVREAAARPPVAVRRGDD